MLQTSLCIGSFRGSSLAYSTDGDSGTREDSATRSICRSLKRCGFS